MGSFTAFAAEASLWLAGAAIIASAAGAHWDMPSMPAIDLGGLIAPSSPGAGHSPGASSGRAIESPSGSPGAATTMARYLAITGSPEFQFAVNYSEAMVQHSSNGTVRGTFTGIAAGVGNNCSDSWVSSATKSSHDIILIGLDLYERIDDGAWTHEGRLPSDTCEQVGLFRYQGLADKGPQLKNGAQLQRLEVADAVQFGSYYEKFERKATGQTATQATLVVWVNDDGTPAALQLSGSHNETIDGLPTNVTDTYDYVVTKLSGVTITAPKT